MAGTVKKLQFSEGTDVGAPTDLSLATSTTNLSVYASDAAYVSANGGPAAGNAYINSTLNVIRHYVNGAWRNHVPAQDSADPTKAISVDLTGNTTGKTATLDFNCTDNRTYTYPDASTTIVGTDTTQTLTNKSLTAPNLDSAIINGTTKQIDVSAAGNLAIGASVGANNITIGGSSSTVIIPGNMQVDGTTTTVNSTNLDVEDQNITINNGGNDASSEGAGLTVDRTTVNGSIIYAAAATSKWKVGNQGSEVEIATISGSQVITNKDIDGGTASNTSRMTVPKASTATLAGLTRKEATIAYDTSLAKFVGDNGSAFVTLGSSGSGSGEINAILNPTATDNTTGWSNGTSHTISRVTSGSPLDPVTTTAFSISATSTASESSTSGSYYTFTMPTGLQNRKLKVEFFYTTSASQTWNVSVYQGTTRKALSTDSSGATTLASGVTGQKFTAYFDTDSNTTWTVSLTRTAGSGTTTLVYTNIIVGPGIQPQGAVISPIQAYTPGTQGLGTISSVGVYWRAVGENLHISGRFVLGTTTASEARINLPTGLTVGSQNGTSMQLCGRWSYSRANASNVKQGVVQYTSGQTYVTLGIDDYASVVNVFAAINGNSLVSSEVFGFDGDIIIPIAEWAGRGTLNTAQNDLDYASNSSTADANDTSSLAYGPAGSPLPGALTATRTRTVRYGSSHQDGTKFFFEYQPGGTGAWIPLVAKDPSNGITNFDTQNGVSYGARVTQLNSTDVQVVFGQYAFPSGATYGAAGASWTTVTANTRYRIRREAPGVAVGFGEATSSASGLNKKNLIRAIRLDTDVTSTTSGILQISGLTTGRWYKVHLVGKVLLQNAGVSRAQLAIIHNSVNCGNLFFNVNGNAAIDQGAGITALIQAAASTITVNATITSATVVSSTTGTRDATYMFVEECQGNDITVSNTNSGTF